MGEDVALVVVGDVAAHQDASVRPEDLARAEALGALGEHVAHVGEVLVLVAPGPEEALGDRGVDHLGAERPAGHVGADHLGEVGVPPPVHPRIRERARRRSWGCRRSPRRGAGPRRGGSRPARRRADVERGAVGVADEVVGRVAPMRTQVRRRKAGSRSRAW